jgi:hypothetical protein
VCVERLLGGVVSNMSCTLFGGLAASQDKTRTLGPRKYNTKCYTPPNTLYTLHDYQTPTTRYDRALILLTRRQFGKKVNTRWAWAYGDTRGSCCQSRRSFGLLATSFVPVRQPSALIFCHKEKNTQVLNIVNVGHVHMPA